MQVIRFPRELSADTPSVVLHVALKPEYIQIVMGVPNNGRGERSVSIVAPAAVEPTVCVVGIAPHVALEAVHAPFSSSLVCLVILLSIWKSS